jgi:hypothetical protein
VLSLSCKQRCAALLQQRIQLFWPLQTNDSCVVLAASAPHRLAVATYVAQLLDRVPAEPLDSLLQLACSMFNVSAALLVLCGDRCIRVVRAHCTQGEFKVGAQV